MSTLDSNLNKIDDYRPKIAVIPFENLNKDEDQQFLVDGIAEDLLMELSMVKELSVATRKTCFGFKNKDYTSKEFKEESFTNERTKSHPEFFALVQVSKFVLSSSVKAKSALA